MPADIAAHVAEVGLWDIDPLNLFRITWKNEPTPSGGGFGPVIDYPIWAGSEASLEALMNYEVEARLGCLSSKEIQDPVKNIEQRKKR